MKLFRIVLLSLALSFISFSDILAQKFGHMNSGNLLIEMPVHKTAEKKLQSFQKSLLDNTNKLQAVLDKKAEKLKAEIDGRTLPQAEAEAKYLALQKEQENIIKIQQGDQQKLMQKRDELLLPIIKRVEKAIQDVGKENGYAFIFDTSVFNAILYAQDSEDITPLVKAKLGL